jgi:AraC-like DNA-binding protein
MSTVWRAANLAPSERGESFVDLVSESIVPYGDPRGMVLGGHDEVRTADVGMLRVMPLRWTQGAAVRSSRSVRRSDPELCKIDVSFAGRFTLEQSDRQAALCAGSFTFVDLSRPHRVAARRAKLTAVMFPRALLPLRDKDIRELAGTTFGRTEPGGAMVTSVVREMTDNLDTYEGRSGARLGASVLDLISATLAARLDRASAVPYESRRRTLVLRIRAYIDGNLGDPDLAPPLVAARHHISPRQLHKLFEDQGTTVAGLIRSSRLARCRHDLLDPAQATKPVSAIAARWGLRDPAYFNRLFQAETGMTPGEYRRLGVNPLKEAS